MADQGVSSLTNVVVSIFVARSLPAEGFGAFGVATVVYLLALGTSRALIGEPLLSRYSHVSADRRRGLVPDMLGAALVVSAIAAGLVAGLGLTVGGSAGSALLALAAPLPVLIVQDVLRYACIIDRPGSALGIDIAWLLAICVALPFAPAGAGAAWFVSAWGLTAGAGVLVGFATERSALGVPRPGHWLADNREMGIRFFTEFLTGQAVGQLVLTGVGAIAGLRVLGGVRAAQVFYGPINTIHAGIYLALVPEGAIARREPRRLLRLMVRASVVLVFVALVWTAVGLVLPHEIGAELFGASWPDARDLMLPMGLAMVAGSVATGGFAGLRALAAARASLRAKLQTVPGQLVLPLAGAAGSGAGGYAVGFGLGHLASAVIYWAAFVRALPAEPGGRPEPAPVQSPSDAADGPTVPASLL
jgi:hypothetical protein